MRKWKPQVKNIFSRTWALGEGRFGDSSQRGGRFKGALVGSPGYI